MTTIILNTHPRHGFSNPSPEKLFISPTIVLKLKMIISLSTYLPESSGRSTYRDASANDRLPQRNLLKKYLRNKRDFAPFNAMANLVSLTIVDAFGLLIA